MNPLINCKFCNQDMNISSCHTLICKYHKDMLIIYDDISKIYPFWSIAKDGFEIGNISPNQLIVFSHKNPENINHTDMILNSFYYGSNVNDKGTIINLNTEITPHNFDSILKRIKILLPFL